MDSLVRSRPTLELGIPDAKINIMQEIRAPIHRVWHFEISISKYVNVC